MNTRLREQEGRNTFSNQFDTIFSIHEHGCPETTKLIDRSNNLIDIVLYNF